MCVWTIVGVDENCVCCLLLLLFFLLAKTSRLALSIRAYQRRNGGQPSELSLGSRSYVLDDGGLS